MENQDQPKAGRGRPVGSTNRLIKEARERARETGELPHEFLLRISQGQVITRKVMDPITKAVKEVVEEYDFDARRDAAKAAAPYFAPKISTVEVIRGVQDDDLDALIAELAAQAGVVIGAGGEEPEAEGTAGEDGDGRRPPRKRIRID